MVNILLVVGMIVFSGCATQQVVWDHRAYETKDERQVAIKKDYYACEIEAGQAGYQANTLTVAQQGARNVFIKKCLKTKGWIRVEKKEDS